MDIEDVSLGYAGGVPEPEKGRCRLEAPSPEDGTAFADMMAEWRAAGGRMNPGLLRLYGGNYAVWLRCLADWDAGIGTDGEVPQTLYFLKGADGALLGAVAVRHYLNHTNTLDGGHVAYGVRPSCRGRGYGNAALRLALKKLAMMGITRVLVTCDSDNELSRKVILRCGGVLENHARDEDGVPIDRFWIENA